MKVKHLFEAPDLSKNRDLLVHTLREHCRTNLKALISGQAPVLFRGMNATHYKKLPDGFMFDSISPRTEPRKSASASNLVLGFVSGHPKWSHVPNRAVSNSFTNNINHAEGFSGAAWLAIPYDDVENIAVTEEDFNFISVGGESIMMKSQILMDAMDTIQFIRDSRSDDRGRMPKDLMAILSHQIFGLKLDEEVPSIQQLKVLSSMLEKLERYDYNVEDETESKYIESLLDTMLEVHSTFHEQPLWDFLEENITPHDMGVSLFQDYLELETDAPTNEVWFEGNFVILRPPVASYEHVSELAESDWLKELAKEVG